MGMSQRELADTLGVSHTYISKMEGEARPLTPAAKIFAHDAVKWFANITVSSQP